MVEEDGWDEANVEENQGHNEECDDHKGFEVKGHEQK